VNSHPRDRDRDLEADLSEQLQFLASSGRAFDPGDLPESERIALVIRVLVHDTDRSRGLLAQIGIKESLAWADSAPVIDNEPNIVGRSPGLTAMGLGAGGITFSARHMDYIEKSATTRYVSFSDWWERPVILDSNDAEFSRRELVLALVNKDGGAHLDRLNEKTHAFVHGNSAGFVRISRCVDDDCRQRVWRRRVDAYLTSSHVAESEIMRILLRERAVQLADKSGIRDLRECAAAVLQTARDRDLSLIRVESSSELYEELFEEIRDGFIAGDTWQQALASFATCGPLNGNTERNREMVRDHHNLSPLASLFPATVFGPGNLPYFRATTPDEKFEYDLTKLEAQIIAGLCGPLIAALHAIPRKFGLPTTQELAGFLDTWPGIHRSALPSIVLALQRFWVGDTPGSIHTLVPKIETLIRELLIRIDFGMYALEQSNRPGQYPALGFLIDALAGRFDISESGVRFLKVVMNEPAGLNIRNQFAHGIVEYGDVGTAALVIHTALFVGTLEQSEPAAEDGAP